MESWEMLPLLQPFQARLKLFKDSNKSIQRLLSSGDLTSMRSVPSYLPLAPTQTHSRTNLTGRRERYTLQLLNYLDAIEMEDKRDFTPGLLPIHRPLRPSTWKILMLSPHKNYLSGL